MPGYLEIADSQVGYRGNPENVTKYWADLQPSFQGLAWCGAFVSWCLWKAGSLSAIGGEMFYVPAMVDRARSRKQWGSNPQVGSLAIFDFGSGHPQHVGFVVAVGSGGNFTSIEGNTGDDLVARRSRTPSASLGFWHISAPTGSVTPGTGDSGPTTYGGMSNVTRVAAAAPTITGSEGESAVRFGARGRFINA